LAAGTLVALAIAQTNLVGSTWIVLLIAGIGFGAVGFVDDLTGALPITIRLALQFAAAAAVVAILWDPRVAGNARRILGRCSGDLLDCLIRQCFQLHGRHQRDLVRGNHRRRRRDRIARPPRTPTRLQAAAFALVAGAIGFAPFNFPTARVFLGDVGSYFAGAWLAVLVVLGLRGSIPPEAIVAPVALYVADTGLTLARRVQRHEPWHEPHRQHAYQRLVVLGWSHKKTAGVVFTLVTMCALLGSVSLLGSVPGRVAADCGIVLLVVGYLDLPRRIEHRQSPSPRGGRPSRAFRFGADR